MEIRFMTIAESRGCDGYAVAALIMGITATCCIMPLAAHGGLPAGHDTLFHLFQAEQFDQGMREGLLYPRWAAGFNNGYGSPNFIFYAPLSYYFIAAIHLFATSLVISVVIAAWFGFFLSGMSMFHAARRSFGKSGSIMAAMLYQFLPFHVLNLYIRGAIAEFLAFIWLPLAFLFLREALESGKDNMISPRLGITYAALILTHLVSGFIFTVIALSYIMYYYFRLERTRVTHAFLSLLAGLGLSAFYVIPLVYEMRFVHINYIAGSSVGDYRKNFLFMWGSHQAGLKGFYFLMHAGVMVETVLFVFIMLSIRGSRMSPSRADYSFFVLLFSVAFFLTTPLSAFLWRTVPMFSVLQFPWRWIDAMEISLCFLTAAFLSGVWARPDLAIRDMKVRKRRSAFLAVTLAVVSLFIIFRSKVLDERSLTAMIMPDNIGRYMEPVVEYTPVWTNNINRLLSEKKERVSAVRGSVVSRIVQWKSEERIIDVNAAAPAVLRIATFYYPGWRARLDNVKVPIAVESGTGAMLVGIPPGDHVIRLAFGGMPVRHVSWIISMVSGAGLILTAGSRLKKVTAR